ncbi:MAG: hypothetical protein WC763_06295 [Candidatus Paceibacterota bacterium]
MSSHRHKQQQQQQRADDGGHYMRHQASPLDQVSQFFKTGRVGTFEVSTPVVIAAATAITGGALIASRLMASAVKKKLDIDMDVYRRKLEMANLAESNTSAGVTNSTPAATSTVGIGLHDQRQVMSGGDDEIQVVMFVDSTTESWEESTPTSTAAYRAREALSCIFDHAELPNRIQCLVVHRTNPTAKREARCDVKGANIPCLVRSHYRAMVAQRNTLSFAGNIECMCVSSDTNADSAWSGRSAMRYEALKHILSSNARRNTRPPPRYLLWLDEHVRLTRRWDVMCVSACDAQEAMSRPDASGARGGGGGGAGGGAEGGSGDDGGDSSADDDLSFLGSPNGYHVIITCTPPRARSAVDWSNSMAEIRWRVSCEAHVQQKERDALHNNLDPQRRHYNVGVDTSTGGSAFVPVNMIESRPAPVDLDTLLKYPMTSCTGTWERLGGWCPVLGVPVGKAYVIDPDEMGEEEEDIDINRNCHYYHDDDDDDDKEGGPARCESSFYTMATTTIPPSAAPSDPSHQQQQQQQQQQQGRRAPIVPTTWFSSQFAFGRTEAFSTVPYDPRFTSPSMRTPPNNNPNSGGSSIGGGGGRGGCTPRVDRAVAQRLDYIWGVRLWCGGCRFFSPTFLVGVQCPDEYSAEYELSEAEAVQLNETLRQVSPLVDHYRGLLAQGTSVDSSFFSTSSSSSSTSSPSSQSRHQPMGWSAFINPSAYESLVAYSGIDWVESKATADARLGIFSHRSRYRRDHDIALKHASKDAYQTKINYIIRQL